MNPDSTEIARAMEYFTQSLGKKLSAEDIYPFGVILATALEQARQRVDRLERALKPFGEVADLYRAHEDNMVVMFNYATAEPALLAADLRRAREALAASTEPKP